MQQQQQQAPANMVLMEILPAPLGERVPAEVEGDQWGRARYEEAVMDGFGCDMIVWTDQDNVTRVFEWAQVKCADSVLKMERVRRNSYRISLHFRTGEQAEEFYLVARACHYITDAAA